MFGFGLQKENQVLKQEVASLKKQLEELNKAKLESFNKDIEVLRWVRRAEKAEEQVGYLENSVRIINDNRMILVNELSRIFHIDRGIIIEHPRSIKEAIQTELSRLTKEQVEINQEKARLAKQEADLLRKRNNIEGAYHRFKEKASKAIAPQCSPNLPSAETANK